MPTHTLLVDNRRAFEREVSRLNKRAARVGVEPITYKSIGRKTAERLSIIGVDGETMERRVPVMVDEYAVTLPDFSDYRWELIATVTPLDDPTHRAFIDQHKRGYDLDRFSESDPRNCDHCHAKRNRSLTYIVRNKDTSQILQVGRTCFQDYVGHEGLLSLEFQSVIISTFGVDDPDFIFPGGCRTVDALAVREIILTAEAIATAAGKWENNQRDEFGEIYHQGTHRQAAYLLRRRSDLPNDQREAYKAARAKLGPAVDAIITELQQLVDPNDEFAQSLAYCAQFEYVPAAKASLVAYSGQFLRNRAERALRNARKAQMRHVGTVGKRSEFGPLVCRKVRSFETDYGVSHLMIFDDPDGNCLTWFSSSAPFTEGETIAKVRATVKAHNEYDGAPQTVVQRVKELA